MTDATDALAAETALTPRRLFVPALIVAALASLAASLILWGTVVFVWQGEMPEPSTTPIGETIMGMLFVSGIATIVAFPVVLAALLLLAVPLTVLLVRRRVAPVMRSLVLLAVAIAAALLIAAPFFSRADPSSAWIFPPYALAAGIFWVLALRRLERAGELA